MSKARWVMVVAGMAFAGCVGDPGGGSSSGSSGESGASSTDGTASSQLGGASSSSGAASSAVSRPSSAWSGPTRCGDLVAPPVPAPECTCSASGISCAPNGCYNGFWCNVVGHRCERAPTSCPASNSAAASSSASRSSSSSPTSSASGTLCGVRAGPGVDVNECTCSASGTTCAANDCYGGFWCNTLTRRCESPSACTTSTTSSGPMGPPDGGTVIGGTCGSVPVEGVCVAPDRVQACVVPTQGQPYVAGSTCADSERCTFANGTARCRATTDACRPQAARCFDATRLQTCDARGLWSSQVCASGCVVEEIGAHCKSALATATLSGVIRYESIQPNQALTDWSSTVVVQPALGMLLATLHGTDLIGTSFVQPDGSFTIEAPSTLGAEDTLVAMAMRTAPGGLNEGFDYQVLRPPVGTGEQDLVGFNGRLGQTWQWSFPLQGRSNGAEFLITIANGAGAAHVTRILRNMHAVARANLSGTPRSLAVWIRPGTTWTCGACELGLPIMTPYGLAQEQMFVGVDSDQGYWSSAVLYHESGHWMMASFIARPMEGGMHAIGCTSTPGMAYSEGWATYFSSHMRNSPIYYDKQNGGFFWVNIEGRAFSSGRPWNRPSASAGLAQWLDENELAGILWGIRQGLAGDATYELIKALEFPGLMGPPFRRGYHVLNTTSFGPGCARQTATTTVSAPMLADYLDAVRCRGVAAATVDTATQPTQYYPYPSSSPICNAPSAPWTLRVETRSMAPDTLDVSASVEGLSPLPADLTVSWELPAGVTLTAGERSTTISAGQDTPWKAQFRVQGSPDGLARTRVVADLQASFMGWHATRPLVAPARTHHDDTWPQP